MEKFTEELAEKEQDKPKKEIVDEIRKKGRKKDSKCC